MLIFLGDSITERWRGLPMFNRVFSKYKPLNLGRGGATTAYILDMLIGDNCELLKLIKSKDDNPSSKMVFVIMIGINDFRYNNTSVIQVFDYIKTITSKILRLFPSGNILLRGLLPHQKIETGRIRASILELNKLLESYCDGTSIRFLNDYDNFVNKKGEILSGLMPDYLHLSRKGYKIVTSSVVEKLKNIYGEI